MTNPSVTYSFVNSAVADANEVNTNFQNIISAMVGGDEDFYYANQKLEDSLQLKILATGTSADLGFSRIYAKSNGVFRQDESGVEKSLGGGGGGGGSLRWELIYSPAPIENEEYGLRTVEFNENDSQGIYAHVTVPNDYAGAQIFMKGGKFATSATSGNILFQSVAYLIKPGTTELTTLANYHTSVNSQLTAVTANIIRSIGDLDITTSSGVVDSLTVSGGDTILILLKRNVASETVAATFTARLLRDSFYLVFS